jgi:hypothetical protein
MESLDAYLKALQALPVSVFIHKTPWAFTTVELIHVFAISLVVGTIAIVDLRLLGVISVKRPFTELSRRVLPFTWAAFVVAVVAGAFLFISNATAYFNNTTFRIKMLLIVAAGINMLVFELITARSVAQWNVGPLPPTAARAAGAISLASWVLVVALGRWTGFDVLK